jgi:hypothetical protein
MEPGERQGVVVDIDAPHVVRVDDRRDRLEVAALAAADLERRPDAVRLDEVRPECRAALVQHAVALVVGDAELTGPQLLELRRLGHVARRPSLALPSRLRAA